MHYLLYSDPAVRSAICPVYSVRYHFLAQPASQSYSSILEALDMQLGNTILVLALVFYMTDFGAILTRRSRFGIYSLMIAGFLTILAYVSFLWSFITDNFMLKAVYEQSSRSLSPLLKLSASWTGAGGSLLLWLLMMTVSSLIFRLRIRRSMNDQHTVASLIMSFFTMTVLAFALAT